MVTVKTAAGSTAYTAGTDVIPYVDGASYSFGGVSMSMAGKPVDGDSFTVSRNAARRQRQPQHDADGPTAIGDLARQRLGHLPGRLCPAGQHGRQQDARSAGQRRRRRRLLAQATAAQQSVSGVNLDEEAANLLKYQQAYQAAGKVMQIASTLFDTLLSLGR